MKIAVLALIIVSAALVAVLVILVVKSRNWARNEATADKFTIHPDDIPLDKAVLTEIGFKVYDTKDQIYALNTTGVSMTWVEGQEWVVEILDGRTRWSDHVYTVKELAEFAQRYGKEIKADN